ncbi:MAG: hypothetical protein KTR27_08940 [Leptolyngbyaceae cyanobacterium MAG.088]|nr:hypothetical protein [Leptolyngbyaceae cyanobacterium MAG.088]
MAESSLHVAKTTDLRPMTLMPDTERSRRTNTYPENANYVLYELVWALGIVMVCLLTAVALVSHS